MAILNQKRILNLIPKVSAPVTLHVSQGDVGTEIQFTLVKGDELFVDTGNLTASVHGIRHDGANFGVFACTLSGSTVSFPLHSEMSAIKGEALAEIVLVDSQGNKVGSANFGIMVEESVFPLGVTYDNDVSVYESILAYVQTIPAQVVEDYTSKINAEVTARKNAVSAVQSNLNTEINARTNADVLINARIDEIIAPSGEAPSAAEVQDARIGADGVTYSNLGNAIRIQNTDIRTQIDLRKEVFIEKPSINLFSVGYINAADGSYKTTLDTRICIYPEKLHGAIYSGIEAINDFEFTLSAWDENDNFLGVYTTTGEFVNSSTNVKWLRSIIFPNKNYYYSVTVRYSLNTSTPLSINDAENILLYTSKIKNNEDSIEELFNNKYHQYYGINWMVGGIVNGIINENSKRARSITIRALKGDKISSINPSIEFGGAVYNAYSSSNDAEHTYVGALKAFGSDDYIIEEDCWLRIVARFIDQRDISDSDLQAIRNSIIYYDCGHFITDMRGASVAIIGGSVDTHGNIPNIQYPNAVEITITDEDIGKTLKAYPTYYDLQKGLVVGNHTIVSGDIGNELTFVPVNSDVGKSIGMPNNFNDDGMGVWWIIAQRYYNYIPIPVCWSGSSISDHNEDVLQTRTSGAFHPAQIRKCGTRIPGTNERIAPDIIIISGRATNDYSHAPYCKIEDDDYPINQVPFVYPTTDKVGNDYYIKRAYIKTIRDLQAAYPNTIIVLSTLGFNDRVSHTTGSVPDNGTNTLMQFNKAIREVADFMGCEVIETYLDGINEINLSSYTSDGTHLTQIGHNRRADAFIGQFEKISKLFY